MTDVRLTATNPEDSSVVPVACNAKGELKLEEVPTFDGNVDGDLTVSGNATFDGEVTIGTNPNQAGAPAGIQLRDRGQVIASRAALEPVWTGYTTGDVNYTSIIFGNGSASFGSADFAGNVTIDNNTLKIDTRRTSSGYKHIDIVSTEFGDPAIQSGSVFSVLSSGSVRVRRAIAIGGDQTDSGSNIYLDGEDGSVTFTNAYVSGEVHGGRNATTGATVYTGVLAFANAPGTSNYAAVSGRNLTTNGYVFAGCNAGSGAKTSHITEAGAAYFAGGTTFAGNKAGFTAEGYLWCTTRRGDTVILDATSNGLASWVPYTPPNRLTELQDRWSEKDGILPVPHESSQDEPETPQ